MRWLATPTIVAVMMLMSAVPAALARGSCNAVAQYSTCIDYSGNYWHGNYQAMKSHCQGYGVTYSRFFCTKEDPWDAQRFGTCIYHQFKPFEFMTHFYTLGNAGFDKRGYDFNVSRMMCQRTGGIWVWGPRSGLNN